MEQRPRKPEDEVERPGEDRVSPIRTAADVVALTRSTIDGAAVGAALELGLFWLLDRGALDSNGVQRELGIQGQCAGHWLRLLASIGLLDETPHGFVPSVRWRDAILASYSPDTWALLAQEAREDVEPLVDLPERLREARSHRRSGPPQSYVDRMAADPERARRFTRMLYELHEPLAKVLAERLDLRGAHRLMDLGGGSGVVSMALLRQWPDLAVTVVDIENVCAAGREIAKEHGLESQLAYQALDFQVDSLPTGFDVVLECDVGVYGAELFAKVCGSLEPGGRFLIVDELEIPGASVDRGRLRWAFQRSLADPGFAAPTEEAIASLLREAGFEPAVKASDLTESLRLIEAVAR